MKWWILAAFGFLVIILIDAYYVAGPRVLVYQGPAEKHYSHLGGLVEKMKLKHDGYKIISAGSPSDLKSKLLQIHVDRIIYMRGRGHFVLFIDDTTKTAIYYNGQPFIDGEKVHVLKPLWILK